MAFNYTDQANGVGVPFNYTRGNPIPLDSWSLFMTLGEAETYAKTNPVSYPGQIITVIGDGTPTAYVISAGQEIEDPSDSEKTIEDQSTRKLVPIGQTPTAKVFATAAEANAYAATDEATVGEVVYVEDTKRAYVVQQGDNNTKTTYRTATYQEVQEVSSSAVINWLNAEGTDEFTE